MGDIAPVELSVDCPACGLEGGVVEVYDARVPACRFGVPARTRCKLCASASESRFHAALAEGLDDLPANRCPSCREELGPRALDDHTCVACGATVALVTTSAPRAFETLADFEDALDRWALREGFASRAALVGATFTDQDITTLFERRRRGERLEVLADPFAKLGGAPPAPAAPAAPVPAAPAPAASARANATVPLPPAAASPAVAVHDAAPPSAPPRAIVYPLVSVIAADGEIHPEERALVDRFLAGEGLAPLSESEICVHHPSAVAHFVPRERREDVVKLMCETAAIDGLPDESERRVIRAYATAWDVDDEKLEFWMWGYESMNTSVARQLFLKLRRFVLSARWG